MKKVTSALALAALVGTPAAAMANVEFGGDFDALYYNTQGTGDQATGFEQRIRLQSVFETDGGVQVHTRLNLMNDRWSGDGSGVDTDDETPFTAGNRAHRNVELDYGYVSVPFAGGRVNVGRQMSNWGPTGLTATDDRRDRISYVRPLGGGHTGIAIYDRRQATDETDRSTDGNSYLGALVGPLAEGVQYGLLVAQFTSGGSDGTYALRGSTLLSPYIEGQAGDFNYGAGFHYLGDGRALYSEDTIAGYIHGGFQMTPEFKLEGQVFHAADGALIAGGYDSYSSLINNSPDHDQSATSIGALNLSGLGPRVVADPTTGDLIAGTEGQDGMSRTLVATRGTFQMMDWTFIGALGWVNYDESDLGGEDEDVVFVDAQAHYQLTPSTKVFATAGYADVEEDQFGREDFYATSLNLNVQF